MGLNLKYFSDDVIHASGFGGEDGGVVCLGAVPQLDIVLRHG
jgi:hypothetical protein